MKQFCVISCPLDTYSGYGARSRDFVKAIYELKKDEWDFQILSQRWGQTPWGYIKDNQDDWNWVEPLINYTGQLQRQPDVWIQITVPNEFQPIGKYNIGVTAGIETTICDVSWIEGVNRMTKTLVSSAHAKSVFEQSAFERKDQQNNVTQVVKLEKPVDILFEGLDLNKYFYIADEDLEETDLVLELDQIKEDFCYLFVGHWMQGEIGEDRKNVGLMIKTFFETFEGRKNKPGLVIKTSSAGSSIMDREEILNRINQIRTMVGGDLPNVYLLHGELDDKDINDLYNHGKIKAMINITKGEGYGRPLLEFTTSKKPIITSGWSGHIDFLNQEFNCLVSGELKPVHGSAVVPNMILAESYWFSPDILQVMRYLKDVFENYQKYQELAKRQSRISKTKFSFEEMKNLLNTYLDIVPKPIPIKLPQLKKIELPKLNKA